MKVTMQLNHGFWGRSRTECEKAIELKYSLIPYIYTYAREAHDAGLPIMRPMFLEYPYDMETLDTDAQFMFGKELLIAPVVKKNAKTKNLYLPEGNWLNYNDKRTLYSGEQWLTVDAPLSCIPMFVKQGSIIPTMPVMNYIGEHPEYPVIFEVFPAVEGQSASFLLYEDEGTDLGYLKDEFLKTPINVKTTVEGFEIAISPREGSNYQLPSKRNMIFRFYVEKSPQKVVIAGKKQKKVKPEKLHDQENIFADAVIWSYDKEMQILNVLVPDSGEALEMSIIQ